MLTALGREFPDAGLLSIRVGVGLSMLVVHGYGKLTAGPDMWERLGGQMARFGLDFLPMFWGFMAMFSEFFCAALVVLGVAFRPAAALLVITMFVAAVRHLSLPAGTENSGLSGASHALEFMFVFLGLFISGPGRYALRELWRHSKRPASATDASPSI